MPPVQLLVSPTPMSPAYTVALPPEFERLAAPDARLQASVIIPARDEARNIESTLDALANQRNGDGTRFDPARFEIILGCNNCRDETAKVARRWGTAHPAIRLHVVESNTEPAQANVGYARRTLMNAAYARLSGVRLSGGEPGEEPRAICSTDADTQVLPHWLSAILAELAAGADAVGGRIYVERGVEHNGSGVSPRRTYLLDTAYRLSAARLESALDPQCTDAWPRHFQFFGASLALRPETYALVGGLPRAECLEDVLLERELRRHDVALRHSPHVAVLTSNRAAGRVSTGLSTQLSEWHELGKNRWLVPSGHEIAARTRARRRLRGLFGALDEPREAHEWQEVAHALLLSPHELRERTRAATYFGTLWDEVWERAWQNPQFRDQWQPLPVEAALQQLRAMLCHVGDK